MLIFLKKELNPFNNRNNMKVNKILLQNNKLCVKFQNDIYIYIKKPNNHVSVTFDAKLMEVYSFGKTTTFWEEEYANENPFFQ